MVFVMFVGARREIEVGWVSAQQNSWSVLLRRGCIELWQGNIMMGNRSPSWVEDSVRPTGLHAMIVDPYFHVVSLPWRPIHLTTTGATAGSMSHGLLIPLWHFAVVSLLVAGYSHGVIVGMRRAAVGKCRRCGYDIVTLSPGKPCPECGEEIELAPASGEVTTG